MSYLSSLLLSSGFARARRARALTTDNVENMPPSGDRALLLTGWLVEAAGTDQDSAAGAWGGDGEGVPGGGRSLLTSGEP